MKRRLLAFITILTLLVTLLPTGAIKAAPAQTPIDHNDTVNIIVKVKGQPVLAQKKAQSMGAKKFLETKKAISSEQALRDRQADVLADINQLNGTASPVKADEKSTAKAVPKNALTASFNYTHVYNGFAITVPRALLDDIQALPEVEAIYPDHRTPAAPPIHPNERSIQNGLCCTSIGVPTLHKQNVYGENQVVAVIDTELDVNHEFFAGEVTNPALTQNKVQTLVSNGQLNIPAYEDIHHIYRSSKMPFVYNYYDSTPEVFDANPSAIHGTHVSGIACGRNGTTPSGQLYNGVAPEAQLLFFAAADPTNYYFDDSAVIAAVDDATKLGADVINMSFGADYYEASEFKTEAMDNARHAGVFLAAASSNSSRTPANFNHMGILPEQIDYSSLGEPANIESTTAIASNDTTNTGFPMSDFSGWGPTNNLSIKPELTAPGGEIYSSVPTESHDRDHYDYLSGCSMATPHISGCVALLKEYMQIHQGDYIAALQEIPANEFIENLMMSTATILRDDFGSRLPYSPRHQGAGQINLETAIQTPVILTTDIGKTKINLYDSINTNTNQFTLDFNAYNFSNTAVTYNDIDVSVLTDDTNASGYLEGMKQFPVKSIEAPESITIPAGETLPISITVTLDAQATKAQKRLFTNGFFIDGFVSLMSNDNDLPQVNIPYSGFYGNWDAVPAFDLPLLDSDTQRECTYLYTESDGNTQKNILGTNTIFNAYTPDPEEALVKNPKYSAYSPNGDGWGDTLSLNLETLRNATLDSINIQDHQGNIIYEYPLDQYTIAKFSPDTFNFSEANGILRQYPSDERFTVNIEGRLDQPGTPTEHIALPFYIDCVQPTIADWSLDDTTLQFQASDDNALMGAMVRGTTLAEGTTIEVFLPATASSQAAKNLFNYDVSELDPDSLSVSVYDYALNHYDVHGANFSPFEDVTSDDWFYDAVMYVKDHQLMMGVDAQNFAPNRTTNRAQLVTTLWRMAGCPQGYPAPDYNDLTVGAYYTDAIAWAMTEGIVSGYGNNCFGPNDTLTREQMATIFYRFARYQENDLSVQSNDNLSHFYDVQAVSDWAVEALNWAVEKHLINGMPNNLLAPQGTTTRAQLATVLSYYDQTIKQ